MRFNDLLILFFIYALFFNNNQDVEYCLNCVVQTKWSATKKRKLFLMSSEFIEPVRKKKTF